MKGVEDSEQEMIRRWGFTSNNKYEGFDEDELKSVESDSTQDFDLPSWIKEELLNSKIGEHIGDVYTPEKLVCEGEYIEKNKYGERYIAEYRFYSRDEELFVWNGEDTPEKSRELDEFLQGKTGVRVETKRFKLKGRVPGLSMLERAIMKFEDEQKYPVERPVEVCAEEKKPEEPKIVTPISSFTLSKEMIFRGYTWLARKTLLCRSRVPHIWSILSVLKRWISGSKNA